MFNLTQTPGRTALIDGKEYLFFSGYNYLGMSHVSEFVDLVKKGIDKYGWLFPSSRISNTRLELFAQLETKLCEITGLEETVTFSSGFLAGRAIAELFNGKAYTCAPGSHPAICLEENKNKTFEDWKQELAKSSIAFLNSVHPLTAEVNDISFLNDFPNITTYVIDDSHGAGLLNGGKGYGPHLKNKIVDHAVTYSLSKAYNLVGGAISCTKEIAQALRRSPLYTGGTSISPTFAYTFLNGQELYQQQREKLTRNIQSFNDLTGKAFKSHPELPIFILPADISETKLADAGIIISSFAYPNPQGEKINRIILNALHTENDLQQLVNALQ